MEGTGGDRTGTLVAALDNAANLLGEHSALAETQARVILDNLPGQQQALFLLVSARRAEGDLEGACALLEPLAEANPGLASVQYELGLVLAAVSRHDEAISALSRVVELEPGHLAAWRALGVQLLRKGDRSGAGRAFARYVKGGANELRLLESAEALANDQLAIAENMVRQLLAVHPTDVSALQMLERIAVRRQRMDEAEILSRQTLDGSRLSK